MMARQPAELLMQELSCAICLQLYQDPVSLPCGHSYCQACVFSAQTTSPPCCPECRQPYEGPEVLLKNFKLSGIVEGFRAAMSGGGLPAAEVAREEVTVPCDRCPDGTVPAVKTCLHCNSSLCQAHLTEHHERHGSRTHTMTDPVAEHDARTCPKHGQDVQYLCSCKRLFLCSECVMDGTHPEHEIQTLEAARGDLRRVVESLGKSTSDRLQMTLVLLRSMRDKGRNTESASEQLAARATILLNNMSARITDYKERMCALVDDELQEREKVWQSSVDALNEYQQELSEAQGASKGLLASSSSDILFIHHYLALEPRLRRAATVSVPPLPESHRGDTTHLRTSLSTDDFRSEISDLLQCLLSLLNPLELTFNPATLHPSLVLSSDLQTVRHGGGAKTQPGDQGERFSTATQVMCQQGFTRGTHVWAVELGSACAWSAGLCYGNIPRKGEHSKLGHNALSWKLQWKNKKLTAYHDSVSTMLGEVPAVPLKTLEVALDYKGGSLAFYSIAVNGRRQHLHTFRATFKEAVYPAFALHSTNDESWITLLRGV